MKKAKRKNAARRPDVRTGGEAPRPEGLDRVENAGSPAAREAALAGDAARGGDSRALAGGVPAQDDSHREDNLPPESDSGGEDGTSAPEAPRKEDLDDGEVPENRLQDGSLLSENDSGMEGVTTMPEDAEDPDGGEEENDSLPPENEFPEEDLRRVEDMPPEDALNDESNLSASETVAEDMENGDVKADEGEATKDGEEAESSGRAGRRAGGGGKRTGGANATACARRWLCWQAWVSSGWWRPTLPLTYLTGRRWT